VDRLEERYSKPRARRAAFAQRHGFAIPGRACVADPGGRWQDPTHPWTRGHGAFHTASGRVHRARLRSSTIERAERHLRRFFQLDEIEGDRLIPFGKSGGLLDDLRAKRCADL